MRKHSVLLGIAALIIGYSLWSYVSSYLALREETALASTSPSSNLEERGRQLRAAIDQTYKKMGDAHTVTTTGVNDISPVILRYIPLGISFDNAEKILRSTGFKIWPRPGPIPPKMWDKETRYAVIALIDPYDSPGFSKTVISVTLIPQVPLDYTRVSKINARFSIIAL